MMGASDNWVLVLDPNQLPSSHALWGSCVTSGAPSLGILGIQVREACHLRGNL